jgi:hypothetical protein
MPFIPDPLSPLEMRYASKKVAMKHSEAAEHASNWKQIADHHTSLAQTHKAIGNNEKSSEHHNHATNANMLANQYAGLALSLKDINE